ncbi:MAG TPA: LuxR C-terminal-related transcriptional regulator [Candidatus Margulisiibacteriota bacterium]|nr:LuxR C-terminal-related transcriptional regulator [Candidatus Margulisiibacteriota bacterium]
MSKADNLRVQDVRDAYRVIGECRDLGSQPGLWYRRLLEALSQLFGVVQAAGGEAWWQKTGDGIKPISVYSASAEPAADEALHAYHQARGMGDDPVFQAVQQQPGNLVTRTRRQVVSDANWYRSEAFNRYYRQGGLDHHMVSVVRFRHDGATSGIALNRGIGERDFSPRERRLLHFFHAELGRLIGGPLVSATEPGVERLSPRLRETLACLLEGDSEKQAAARLRLSPMTVHQYVTALYRHFGVGSRAQLLAHVMRRIPELAL